MSNNISMSTAQDQINKKIEKINRAIDHLSSPSQEQQEFSKTANRLQFDYSQYQKQNEQKKKIGPNLSKVYRSQEEHLQKEGQDSEKEI